MELWLLHVGLPYVSQDHMCALVMGMSALFSDTNHLTR